MAEHSHDPILHIKDGYFFELPKKVWWPYGNEAAVPKWLRDAHPDATLEEFNEALEGKFLIPQFFGTPKNLYERGSGFCLSKYMVIEALVAALLILIFTRVAKHLSSGGAPRGRFWNFFETLLVYIRDAVARPSIGASHGDDHAHAHDAPEHGVDHHAHATVKHAPPAQAAHGQKDMHHHAAHVHASPFADADKFLPFLWTVFFFILGCNLMGILPWMGSPTAEWGATIALALSTLTIVFVAGFAKFGPIGFWTNQVPSMDLPLWLWWLKPVIFLIEVAGLLIKHAVLSIRLLANMVAGHLVLLAILGLIVAAAELSRGMFAAVATVSVLGTTALTLLEVFVAFLQAYVFTMLSALFIGAAVHSH